ncbi:MAG: IS3 family transposase [Minisyncoccia bacterium]
MSKESPIGTRTTARTLGIARSTFWYQKKKPDKDWALKCRIEEVLREFPSYGYRRVALYLKENKKKVQRVMRLFGIKAYRRRGRRWRKSRKQAVEYPNLLMRIVPAYPHQAWVADFTHVYFKGKDIRVATTMDVYTRSVVGLAIGTRGGTVLVTQALCAALLNHPRPTIFHSDNGVEYNAASFREMLINFGISISRSKKGCPWENGYQESFYGKFKTDLGDPNRFDTLGELVAEIYQTIHRYNTVRIHSTLKMAPREFAKSHITRTLSSLV